VDRMARAGLAAKRGTVDVEDSAWRRS
jgi:hypothetical protein